MGREAFEHHTTTLAEAIVACASRQGPALLAELDPDGGDRAASPGLALDPGLASLAASVRHKAITAEDIAGHLQSPARPLDAQPTEGIVVGALGARFH